MNISKESVEHSSLKPRQVRPLIGFDAREYDGLRRLGINLDGPQGGMVRRMASAMAMAMDSVQATVTTATITTPVQFLQNWLPGFVKVITAARKIDELVGISTIGSWEDEQIVQGILELTGRAVPYGDYTSMPESSWNINYNARTVVRFEEGLRVGQLESARASRIRMDSATGKREAAALALEIIRNSIGFIGFNSGNGNTYGFLNDPGLPNYTTVATGASGSTLWSRKTYLEITADIRTMIANLRNQSQDQIDPETVNMTLAVSTDAVDYLSVVSDFGNSVRDWMTKTYPKIRVVSAPELNLASGGLNVAYLYAEDINDLSTDDGRTFIQVVPTKFQVLGVAKDAKFYTEDYSNATAGVMCKRPWAVVRVNGI